MDKILTEAKQARGCGDGLAWWKAHPGDFAGLAAYRPDWYLWGVENCPSWERNAECLDACAKAAPRDALTCAAALLTPERLDACAKAAPGCALVYAAKLLTPERRAWCEKQN